MPKHFVREWREFRQLSRETLGEQIDTTRATIAHIEVGRHPCTDATLGDIAQVLGVSRAQLLAPPPGFWSAL